ncbi:MAG: hypothetical protein R2851_23885 [Caldilineaceae bacterium]
MSELAQTAAKAKDLAPWRPNLPWWIVLVEGIIIGGMGLLLVVNPALSSINVAVASLSYWWSSGLLQLWAVIRNKVSERLDGIVAAGCGCRVCGSLHPPRSSMICWHWR